MKLLDIEPVHKGKFLKFYNFKLDDGRNYEVVSRNDLTMENVNDYNIDAVDIIAFTEDFNKVLVIKEWRVPVNDYIYAFPAGLREAGETIGETADRELFEETGLKINRVYDTLPPAYQSAGMTNETVASVFCDVYGVLSNNFSTKNEDISPMWITKAEARAILANNKISGRCQSILHLWANDFFSQ